MDGPGLLTALMAAAHENAYAVATSLKKPSLQSYIWKFTNGVAKEPRRSSLQPLADRYSVPVEAFYDPKIAEQIAIERGLASSGSSTTAAEPAPPQKSKPEADELAKALEVLTYYLAKSDEDSRLSVEPLLASLAREPQKAQSKVRLILRLLVTENDTKSTAHHDQPGHISGDLGILDLGGHKNGRSDRAARAAKGGSKE